MMSAGLVLFKAADMAASYPELWKDAKAVENWRKRALAPHSLLENILIGNEGLNGKTGLHDTEPGLAELGFIQGRYRLSKARSRIANFWFHPGLCSEPEARLTATLGSLHLFDLAAAEKPAFIGVNHSKNPTLTQTRCALDGASH